MSAVAFHEIVGDTPEYRDAMYIPIDSWGYAKFFPCLVLGVVGEYVKILVWNPYVQDYVEYVVAPQTITFEDPTHKTELLKHIGETMFADVLAAYKK